MVGVGTVGTGFGISFGGSGGAGLLGARVRAAEGVLEENDGERLVLSRRFSDQLKPSPREDVSHWSTVTWDFEKGQ